MKIVAIIVSLFATVAFAAPATTTTTNTETIAPTTQTTTQHTETSEAPAMHGKKNVQHKKTMKAADGSTQTTETNTENK